MGMGLGVEMGMVDDNVLCLNKILLPCRSLVSFEQNPKPHSRRNDKQLHGTHQCYGPSPSPIPIAPPSSHRHNETPYLNCHPQAKHDSEKQDVADERLDMLTVLERQTSVMTATYMCETISISHRYHRLHTLEQSC